MKFKELLKRKEILKKLDDMGYDTPTPIQEQIMPLIIDGNDVIGQSQTGTGKTLAFAGPILEEMEENRKVQTLILAPTRELAIQIARDIEVYSEYMNIHTTCVYGSSSIEAQIKDLKHGCEIVIGTPGRVKDLIKRDVLKLSEIKFFVLDEADEMLSMGFQEELEFIFDKTNNDRQVLLFSATMSKVILNIAKKYMSSEYRSVTIERDTKTAENITQDYYITSDRTRIEGLCRILDYYNYDKVMIFCRTKRNADELLTKLTSRGYKADVIHGDITQTQRIVTLDKFKEGIFNYLIATDVAARGIHVDDVEMVVNYNLPESQEAYVHRIGRTGRANKSGLAVTFIRPNEESVIKSLEKYIKCDLTKKQLPEVKDIIPGRVDEIVEVLENKKDNKSKYELFDGYLDTLSNEEKNNLVSQLLEEKLLNRLGSNFNAVVETTESKKRKKSGKRDLGDSVRVFLTIGKMDNIEKRDFLSFIEKKARVKEGTCTGVEILPKFTFMNVKNDCYDRIFDAINNTNYNGRLIRIEKAKR